MAISIFVIHTGNTTEPVILWEYSTDGVPAGPRRTDWPEITDATNDTLFLTEYTIHLRRNMFHAVVSGKCPAPVTSDSAVMTVYEKPQIDTHPVDVKACEQETVMFFVDAGVTTNPVYQWEIWNGAAWVIPPPDIYAGVDNDTMYINGIHSGIDGLQVRLRLSGICAPEQISDTAMLTVDERPEVIRSARLDVTICEGDSAFFGISAGVTTDPVYTWEYNLTEHWTDSQSADSLLDENHRYIETGRPGYRPHGQEPSSGPLSATCADPTIPPWWLH